MKKKEVARKINKRMDKVSFFKMEEEGEV